MGVCAGVCMDTGPAWPTRDLTDARPGGEGEEEKQQREREKQEKIEELFVKYDANSSGYLDPGEFESMLAHVQAALMEGLDKQLAATRPEDKEEMEAKVLEYKREILSTTMKQLFNQWDLSNDGKISKQEFIQAVSVLPMALEL
eukprot:TRINITY_DN15238_c0_g1_i1.p2 TRINITY_DN15238_c0_g1~~TRINITY_DN15238_c0_g1_i1.p2  ORF type:complete len:144 (-),score=42.21 TRINITY_DN15238_c0_g1_i1:320-751(-)